MESAPHPSSDAAAKDALRIQAAAVAAQQAALDDEEARLLLRRGALEQQEEQLAAHLEEKRRRLVQLREQAQAARLALQKERAVYHETVDRTRRDLTDAQKEVLQAQDQAQRERKRLVELRRRLKQRWHRHWLAESRALGQRESALTAQRQQLEKHTEALQRQRGELAQERLRATGDMELGKRHLQDEWAKLRQQQQAWNAGRRREQAELNQRAAALARGEAAVARAERELAYDRHQWQGLRLLLEREAEGLDARVLNQRRKIVAQQDEITRLDAVLRGLRPAVTALVPVTIVGGPEAPAEEYAAVAARQAETSPPAPAMPVLARHEERSINPAPQGSSEENDLQRRLHALQQLAGDLADQRLQLVEQWQRLAHTQDRWQRDRDGAAAALEALAAGLPEREQALIVGEQRLAAAGADLQRRHRELLHQRHYQEAWQVRLRAREVAWEAERDRLLADLRGREAASTGFQATVAELRRRWGKRRKEELEQLRGERAANDKLRQEGMALREEWWRRTATLEEQQRVLAEKELALERYRQQILTSTEDAAATERGVERLRRRWARQNAALVRASTEGLRKLQAEAAQLAAQGVVLQKQNDALTRRETAVAEQQTALEHREALARSQEIRMQEEVQRLQAQRDRFEQQNGELQEEVERIAHLLLEESSEILPRQAA